MEQDYTLADFDRINRDLLGGYMTQYDLLRAYRMYAEKKQKERKGKANRVDFYLTKMGK